MSQPAQTSVSQKPTLPPLLARRRILIAIPATIALLLAGGWIASSYYSFEARFNRSKPELDAYATRAMASDPTQPLPQPPPHIGAFKTGQAERLPHGFLFFCDYGHPFDTNGLAYSTKPLPPTLNDHDVFKHIEGNWYTVLRN